MSISAAFLEVAKWQARVGLLTPLPTFCVPCSCCETQWSLCPSKRCCSYAPRVWLREQIKAYSLKTVLWCSALLGKIGGCAPCTSICVSALLRSPWRNPQHGPCFTKYRQNIPLQLPRCGLCRTWHRSMPLVPVLCCVACTMWPSGLCCPAQIPNPAGNSANSSLQRSSSHPGPEVTQIMWPCPCRTVQKDIPLQTLFLFDCIYVI